MESFEPANALEEVLLAAKTGAMPMKILAGTLLGLKVMIPSVNDPGTNLSAFLPLVFNKESKPLVAMFTHESRMLPYREMAPFVVELPGYIAFKQMPREYGILFNANSAAALELSVEGIEEMLRDFGLLSA